MHHEQTVSFGPDPAIDLQDDGVAADEPDQPQK
jgi:hypothetical protein